MNGTTAASAPGPMLTHHGDGIATLSLDREADGPLRFSLDSLHRLDATLDGLEVQIGEGTVAALIVRLGLEQAQRTDLDTDEVRQLPDAAAARVWSREGQRVVQRIERLAVPTVAALAGRCLWAGLQVALACEHRLAVAGTRLGMPESRWGLLPGWGGSVRLPRLIGVRGALLLLLHQETVSARRAESLGLVDDVFSGSRFESAVRHFVAARLRRARRAEPSRRGLATRMLEDTAPGRRLEFARAARRVRASEGLPDHLGEAVLGAVADGVACSLEDAFAREAERFAALLQHPATVASLHHDLLLHGPSCPEPRAGEAVQVRRVAVLGAGTRGAALAHLCASRGISVRLKELRREAALQGDQRVRSLFAWDAERKIAAEPTLAQRLRRVSPTTGYGGFGRLDAVIEAVPERPEVKRRALQEVEEHVRDSCLLLTTSPVIPIAELEVELARPDRLAGLHLFHPAGQRAIAEVVRGAETSEAAVHAACTLARRLGKVPLIVADRPGRVVTRLLILYLHEALWLRVEGADAVQVDAAMLHFGIPTGPLRLFTELGAESVERIARGLEERLGPRFAPPPARAAEPPSRSGLVTLLRRVPGRIRSRAERTGSRGWGQERTPAATLAALQQRMILVMVNEAAHILEEGVVPGPREIDRAIALSIGFPVAQGGLLFHADRIGSAALVRSLLELHARHGSRFAPAPLLCRLAAEGAGFYSARRPPDAGPHAA